MTSGIDGPVADLLLRSGRFFNRGEVSPDLRTINKDKVRRKYNTRFCAGGNRAKCAAAVWRALDAVPGDPDALSANANQERIAFRPGLLRTTIRYTNRPSGIQQVISFAGHRPR